MFSSPINIAPASISQILNTRIPAVFPTFLDNSTLITLSVRILFHPAGIDSPDSSYVANEENPSIMSVWARRLFGFPIFDL